MQSCDFFYRAILLSPESPVEIEVWCHELTPLETGRRGGDEWALEHLLGLDFYDELDLDRSKAWQVLGEGTLSASFDPVSQEWDEWCELDLDAKEEISEEVLNRLFPADGGET